MKNKKPMKIFLCKNCKSHPAYKVTKFQKTCCFWQKNGKYYYYCLYCGKILQEIIPKQQKIKQKRSISKQLRYYYRKKMKGGQFNNHGHSKS